MPLNNGWRFWEGHSQIGYRHAYQFLIIFACSADGRFLPSHTLQSVEDNSLVFTKQWHVHRNSQLGCCRQGDGNSGSDVQSDVHPRQGVSSWQAWSNAYKLAGSSIQYFRCCRLTFDEQSLTTVGLHIYLLFTDDWQHTIALRFREFCGIIERSFGDVGSFDRNWHRIINWSGDFESAGLVRILNIMKASTNHYYLIRYKNLRGMQKEEYVYAFDASQARDLAMEFNAELHHHPGLINAILRVDWFSFDVRLISFPGSGCWTLMICIWVFKPWLDW